MTARKLEKTEWRRFFDWVSKDSSASVPRSRSPRSPSAIRSKRKWLPLLGITFDPKNDILEIALDGLDHLISRPREIYIDDSAGVLSSLEVIDSDGISQIVQLREPLFLPAPPATTA